MTLYYEPIVENKGLKTGLFGKRFVPEKIALQMFPPNLKIIIAANQAFLRKIEQRFAPDANKDPHTIYFMPIADLFINFVPHLEVYISYLTMFETAKSNVKKYVEKHKDFEAWLKKRKKDKMAIGNDMDSLLIMPVQRIPRYKILLENLLKQTPEDHGDYEHLKKAIELINECALLHNEKIRETNNMIKVQQIAKFLKMENLAIPGRFLIREGDCMMNETKQKLYLFNDSMVIREKKKISLMPTIRSYSLVNTVITGGTKESITIQAISLSSSEEKIKILDLTFNSFGTKTDWLKDLTTAISKLDIKNRKSQKPLTSRGLHKRLKLWNSSSSTGRKRSSSESSHQIQQQRRIQ